MRRFLPFVLAVAWCLPSFATEPNPSIRQRELIDKLLDQMNVRANGAAMMNAMFTQMEKQFLEEAAAKGNTPQDIAEAKELFAGFREHTATIDFDALLHEAYVQMYAKHLNEKELAALVAFYSTPAGKKWLEVMPEIMSEAMQAGADILGPRIAEAMKQATEDVERKRPWRRTMADIRTVATALEAYAIDHEDGYPSGDYSGLKGLLVPTYLHELPDKDMWDHAYAYAVSGDGKHYRLVSAGSDTIFEWDSRTVTVPKEGEPDEDIRIRDRLEDDLIYQDGSFLQVPIQAAPGRAAEPPQQ